MRYLYGGLPAGRAALIEGGPGTGKSIMGLEFLYRGALAGEAGITEHKPNYEDLVGQLAEAEETIRALRNQEVDAVVGTGMFACSS